MDVGLVLALVGIIVGAIALITGELIGVFRKEKGDTITEAWVWLRDRTRVGGEKGFSLMWIPLLAGIGWLIYHFAVS